MIFKIFHLSLFIFAFLFFRANAQQDALHSITEDDLRRHVTFLASDRLQGRCFFTEKPGLQYAAEYLRHEAEKAGIEPLADQFFQTFEVISRESEGAPLPLRIFDKHQKKENQSDSVICLAQSMNNFKTAEAKNVIGIVVGSDPELKKEGIIFMAHYDHLGVSPDGDVYNGADDNASGSATLLELGKAFAGLGSKLRRSIVFLWVTAEEDGMLGSEYYTKHPLFPLENSVACINLDMVGRVYEPRDSVWQNSPKMIKDFNGIYTLVSDFSPELVHLTDSICHNLGLVPDKSLPDYFFRTSDHHHFHSRGIPVLNLSTGYHADYHKISDEVSRIRFDKIKRIAELCFWVGYEMANK